MAARSLGKVAVRVSAPILSLLCAVVCIFVYFRVVDADGTGPAWLPLAVGVYLSDDDVAALQSLTGHGAARPSWYVEVAADESGAGQVTVNFGQLQLDQFGQTFGSNATLRGTLVHPITLVYTLPAGDAPNVEGTDPAAVTTLREPRDPSICARWNDAKGHEVQVKTVWDTGGGGWPDVAVCHIPAFRNAQDVDIYAATDVNVSSLRESFTGRSSLSVSNPQTLGTTMNQQSVPQSLLSATSQPYTLYVDPPPGSVLGAVQPPPNGAAAGGVRAWTVRPAGVVAADLIDEHRQNIAEVVEQIMLILAGFFFGLFASTTPWAVRGVRLGKRSARA